MKWVSFFPKYLTPKKTLWSVGKIVLVFSFLLNSIYSLSLASNPFVTSIPENLASQNDLPKNKPSNMAAIPTNSTVLVSSCDPLLVTSNSDNPTLCGTLRYAINFLNANPNNSSKTISFTLSPAGQIVPTSPLILPAGVTLAGSCLASGPGVTINGNGLDGSGLTLLGSNIITGVTIGGFKGTQIKTVGANNKFSCTKIKTTLANYLPPDPIDIAPPLDPGVATDLGTATSFLYTGKNPIQTGVVSGTISKTTAGVIRGKVTDRQGQPLPGVIVTILSHPEYGQTLSRADGMFDMAVNGGSYLTVSYSKKGYLTLQRQISVGWNDFDVVENVEMSQPDPAKTDVNLNNQSTMAVVQGSAISDTNGTRRATLLVPAGTTATMKLPDGTTQPITDLAIRATEYTVGITGTQAMPGTLPANSAYTYATEWSIDQAQSAGALNVNFNQPLIQYLENFLHFSAGQPVPAGYYDREKSQWVADKNGRVVKIVNITNGLADLDTDGDGVADNGPSLEPPVTTEERQKLATLYSAGQTLWRIPLLHFSAWDFNWPIGFPPYARGPNMPKLSGAGESVADPDSKCGSIIECQNQVLGEKLDVAGTPFSLYYSSERVPGRAVANTLKIPLTGSVAPTGTKRIDLEISVAGRTFTQSFPNTATNQVYTFVWDGKDAYGRTLQGSQDVETHLGYVYDGVYLSASDRPDASYDSTFGHFSYYGTPATGDLSRQEVTLWQNQKITIGSLNTNRNDLGGWSLNINHHYDPASHILYLGDGTKQSADALNTRVVTTIAGTGTAGYNGDNIPATQAQLYGPIRVIAAPDGSLYVLNYYPDPGNEHYNTNRVQKITPDGIITTVAGTGVAGFSGDGGPATQAQLDHPTDIALGPDGSLYIADPGPNNRRIRRVDASGIITTVAGGGLSSADGIPANQAELHPQVMAVAPDGTIYIDAANGEIVRRIGTDGIVTTLPLQNFITIRGLTVGSDGSLYISDAGAWKLYRLTPDGRIQVIAGSGICYCNDTKDGSPATQAYLNGPAKTVIGPNGSIYVVTTSDGRVREIGPDGIINTIVGTGARRFSGDGGAATQASLYDPYGMDIAPDGTIYIADMDNYRIRKVTSALPGVSAAGFIVASEDSKQAYIFDASGRHLSTRDTTTGTTLYQFGYDTFGHLSVITDVDGLVTTIQHDTAGKPTSITGPYGQVTALTTDTNGYLASLADPGANTYQMHYTTGGLLTSFTDPRQNTSTMTYTVEGKLIKDQNANGGYFSLGRVENTNGYSVTVTSAEGRTNIYAIGTTSTTTEERSQTEPNNLQSQSTKGNDGTRTSTTPDGSSSSLILGPDPRWGMQAPINSVVTYTAAPGITSSTTTTRSVSLTNPNSLFVPAAIQDTTTINSRIYSQFYDGASQTLTSTTPENRQSFRTINAQDRITSERVAGLDPLAYSYDTQGHLTNLSASSGATLRSTDFSYYTTGPAKGYLQVITDSLNRQLIFGYDNAGRVISQTLPGNRTIGYGYDPKGNLTSLTPPGKPVHTFTYNSIDLPLTYSAPAVSGGGTNQTAYAYNLDGQLTSVTYPDSSQSSFSYDSAGRPGSLTTPSRIVSYTYSPTTGQLTAINVGSGGPGLTYVYNGSLLANETYFGPVAGSVSQTYDNNLWRTSQSVNGANSITFSYDKDGLITNAGDLVVTRNPQNGLVSGSSLGIVSTNLNYNTLGELSGYTAAQGGTTFYSATFTRDKLGHITRKVETINGATDTYDYGYDSVGQLNTVQKNGSPTAIYTYDANGNRLSGPIATTTGSYDAQDRLLSYGSTSYTYNARGDLNGKTNGSQTTQYSYDVESNLLAVTLPDATSIQYIIDGQNRRIGKKINGVVVQGFLYQDDLRPVAELDGAGAIVSRFVYASNENVPGYMVRGSNTYRLLTDQVGSVRLVIDTATGATIQRLDYDEWGNVLTDTNPGFQPFGFAGGLYDRDTQLTRFGARDYDAQVGRWTTKDPLGFGGGATNLYRYVNNLPLDFIDPTGQEEYKTVEQTAPSENTPLSKALEKGKQTWDGFKKLEGYYNKAKDILDFAGKLKNLADRANQVYCTKKKLFNQLDPNFDPEQAGQLANQAVNQQLQTLKAASEAVNAAGSVVPEPSTSFLK